MKRALLASAAIAAFLPAAAFAKISDVPDEPMAEESLDVEDILNGMKDGDASMRMMPPGGIVPPMPGFPSTVTVDVNYTQEVAPDLLNVTGYCLKTPSASQEEARRQLNELYKKIKQLVGSDGRVRKQGGYTVYPEYSMESEPKMYTGNMNIVVRVLRMSAAERITEILENESCAVSYDARVVNTHDVEEDVIDQLLSRLEKRRKVFEKLLNSKLTKVSGIYLSTWAGGWNSFDPEAGTVDATTTLSVTYELGGRARVRGQ